MPETISGIHHITAIAGDARRNLAFYTQVLGLRLVKRTVNFDDPGTYHFYFGDETGQPGTILTFFPWGDIRRGRRGLGQVSAVAFQIPAGSPGYWQERLQRLNVTTSSPFRRMEDEVLTFVDPDGLQIELVATPDAPNDGIPSGANGRPAGVDARYAIRGFAPPTLLVREATKLHRLLEALGFQAVETSGPRTRYRPPAGLAAPVGAALDLEERPNEPAGSMGAGVVHHIALRARDDAEQAAWRERLTGLGYDVTPVLDRQYFRSIYFREPNRILFEIATDPPGFAIDEPVESLGEALKLPAWLEPRRGEIEAILPPLIPQETHP